MKEIPTNLEKWMDERIEFYEKKREKHYGRMQKIFTAKWDTAVRFKNKFLNNCKFYLKYMDKPKLLIAHYPKLEKEVDKFVYKKPEHEIVEDAEYDWFYFDTKKYNSWLFRLVMIKNGCDKDNGDG